MQFFKHMTNMRHDPKVKRLIRKYKANGYAVYNFVLESIAENLCTDSPLPVLEETVNDISYELGITETEVEEIIKFCSSENLLQIVTGTGIVYCVKIYKYINSSQTRDKSIRHLIKTVSDKDYSGENVIQLKKDIDRYILLQDKGLNTSLLLSKTSSKTVCDNRDRKEEIEIEIEIERKKRNKEDKEEKEKIENSSFIPFGSFVNKPQASDFENPLSSLITSSIKYWNTFKNLPECRYNVFNLPDMHDVKIKFDVFRDGEILAAIKNLSECYEKIEAVYRPSSFHKFICNSLDSWLDSAKPHDRYKSKVKSNPEEKTDSEMTAGFTGRIF